MALPYQRIAACNRSVGNSWEWTLIGASGPWLAVQSSSGASSVWPAAESVDQDANVRQLKFSQAAFF